MQIEEFNKYGKVRFHSDEYVLVGMEDTDGCAMGVRIGERCDEEGFYLARWLELDPANRTRVVALVEEDEFRRDYFNPTTEEFRGEIA